jgi:hypothetical protein
MKTSLSLLAACASLALVLSCSSGDDSPKLIKCDLTSSGGLCYDNWTAEQCKIAMGTVVQTCPSNGKVDCTIAGNCIPNTYTAEQCTAISGIIGTCPGGGGMINCIVMGTCMQMLNDQQCTASGGTVVGTCPGSGNNDKVNCMVGGNCIPDVSADLCADVGTPVATCPGGGTSSGGGGTSSSSGGGSNTSSSSKGIDVPVPTGYCDLGYPHSAGGGCFPMYPGDNCDSDYGKVVQKCGRTDLEYCQYAASTKDPEGCYAINNATERNSCTLYGTFKDECPSRLFGSKEGPKTFYCYYYDDEYDELACIKIGYLLLASECASGDAAIVDAAFCSKIGAEIYDY